MQSQKPILTISLLISNRPDTIPRCLDSLKPIMEAIPCELILIDTSKSVEIHNILLEYTEQVYEFEWCKDFAKARNAGLKKAKGEWFMFLDDDEWFVQADELIDFFQSGEYKNYGYANYKIRSFYDAEYTQYNDSWVTRMIKLEEDTEFIGKVHETFYPVKGNLKSLYSLAYHSGYIYETEEDIQKHFERNTSLLLEELKENPTNIRMRTQMVQEYRTIKDWENMVAYCKESVEEIKELSTEFDRMMFATFYAGIAEGLLYLKRHEEGLEYCQQALDDKRSTELLKALIYLRMAEHHLALEHWKEAEEYTGVYFENKKMFDQNEKMFREQSQALLVRFAFESANLRRAYTILVCCDLKRGSTKALHEYYEDLKWNADLIYTFERLGRMFVEAMATMKYEPIFARMMKEACENTELQALVCSEIQKWEEENPKAYEKIAYAVAKTDLDFWFIWYARIMAADVKGNKKEVKKALEGLLRSVSNVFYLPEKIDEIISKYGIKVANLWEKVVGNKWEEQVVSYVINHNETHISMTRAHLYNAFSTSDWKIISFELAVMEKKIVAGPKDPWNMQDYYDVLKMYADIKPLYYQRQHLKAEMIEDLKAAPIDVQAAMKIREYINLEAQDKVLALGKLKEAVDICYVFAEGIGKFLHLYSELERQRVKKQKEEMRQLREQVMEQVKVMAANGQGEAALQIIQQLKQMFPDDLEIIALGLEIRLQTLE